MTLTKEQRDEEFREWKKKLMAREPKKAEEKSIVRQPVYSRVPGEKS